MRKREFKNLKLELPQKLDEDCNIVKEGIKMQSSYGFFWGCVCPEPERVDDAFQSLR